MIKGIDVSHWNKKLDIEEMLSRDNADISFIIAKHSQGLKMQDDTYYKWRDLATKYRLCFGGYHYVDKTSTTESILQRLREIIATSGVTMPPVIDYEENGVIRTKAGNEMIIHVIRLFNEMFGESPMLYLSYSVLNDRDLLECINEYDVPIWLARYKIKGYVPSLNEDTGINPTSLQRMAYGVPVAFQQLQNKCQLNKEELNLDFDICYRPRVMMRYNIE